MNFFQTLVKIFTVTFNKILVLILIFFIFIIAATTIIVKKKPIANETYINPNTLQKDYDEMNLGSLRTTTKADEFGKVASVVITPCLCFEKGDKEFSEELRKKSLDLKNIFKNYFSEFTSKELHSTGDNEIKSNLFERVNSILSLSKIKTIYFMEYAFFE